MWKYLKNEPNLTNQTMSRFTKRYMNTMPKKNEKEKKRKKIQWKNKKEEDFFLFSRLKNWKKGDDWLVGLEVHRLSNY